MSLLALGSCVHGIAVCGVSCCAVPRRGTTRRTALRLASAEPVVWHY